MMMPEGTNVKVIVIVIVLATATARVFETLPLRTTNSLTLTARRGDVCTNLSACGASDNKKTFC